MLIVALGCLALAAQFGDGSDDFVFGTVACSDDLGLPTPLAYNATVGALGGSWWLSAESADDDERGVVDALRQAPTSVELVDDSGTTYAFMADDQGVAVRIDVPEGASEGARFLLRNTETWGAVVLEVADIASFAPFDVTELNVSPRTAAVCRAVCLPEDAPWPESAVLELNYIGGPAILDVLSDGPLLDGSNGPRRYVDSVLLPQASAATLTMRLKAHDIEEVELSGSIRVRDIDTGALRFEQSFTHAPERTFVGEDRAFEDCELLDDDFCFDAECAGCNCRAADANTSNTLMLVALGALAAWRQPRKNGARGK